MRFFSTVDLFNALEQEKAQGKVERIAASLMLMDLVVSRRVDLPTHQSQRRRAAVPPEQALRAHQRRRHHQPRLRRMGQRVRRRQDDHGLARPAHASLPHRATGNESHRYWTSSQAAGQRIKARESLGKRVQVLAPIHEEATTTS